MDVVTFYAAWGLLSLVGVVFMLFLGGDPRVTNVFACLTAWCRTVHRVLTDYLSLAVAGIAGIVVASTLYLYSSLIAEAGFRSAAYLCRVWFVYIWPVYVGIASSVTSFTLSLDISRVAKEGIDGATHLCRVLSDHLWLYTVACIASTVMLFLFEPHVTGAEVYVRKIWFENLWPAILGTVTACKLRLYRSRDAEVRVCLSAFFRTVWSEWLSLVIVFAITLWLYTSHVSFDRHVVPMSPSRAIFRMDATFNDVRFPREISYPWTIEPFSTLSCGSAVIIIPLMVIVIDHSLFAAKPRNHWDLHSGVVGVFRAAVSTSFVTTILKHMIGGFRPYFIDVCHPDWDLISTSIAQGHQFDATVCTGDKAHVNRALQTFPSGHAMSSFAAAIFLSLYLNARLDFISGRIRAFWAFLVVLAPVMLASYVSATMYTTYQHHASDMVFGMIIGLVLGTLSYCSVFAAICDFHCNEFLLHKDQPAVVDESHNEEPGGIETSKENSENRESRGHDEPQIPPSRRISAIMAQRSWRGAGPRSDRDNTMARVARTGTASDRRTE